MTSPWDRLQPVKFGCVYFIEDSLIKFPPEDHRTVHPKRAVLVVSSDRVNYEQNWELAYVLPLSSGSKSHPLDVRISAGNGGVTKKCWARIAHGQAVLKSELQDCLDIHGVTSTVLRDVVSNMMHYTGIAEFMQIEQQKSLGGGFPSSF